MTPYIILASVIAAALAGFGGYQHGRSVERGEQAKVQYDASIAYAGEIVRLQGDERAKEYDHAQRLAIISTDFQKGLADANAQRAHDLAALRSGTLRLRFVPATPAAGEPGESGPAGPRASGRDGPAPSDLPGTVAADLYALLADADATALQLSEAQRVIEEDRRLCGAPRDPAQK